MCTVHKAVAFRLTGKEAGMSCQHGIGISYYMVYSSMLGFHSKSPPSFRRAGLFLLAVHIYHIRGHAEHTVLVIYLKPPSVFADDLTDV